MENKDAFKITSTTVDMDIKKKVFENGDAHKSSSTAVYMAANEEITCNDNAKTVQSVVNEKKTMEQVLTKRQRKRYRYRKNKALQIADEVQRRVMTQSTKHMLQNSGYQKFMKSSKMGNLPCDLKIGIDLEVNNANKMMGKVLSNPVQDIFPKQQHSLDQKTLTYNKLKEKRKMKNPKAEAMAQKLGSSRKLSKSLKMADSPCDLKTCCNLEANIGNKRMGKGLSNPVHGIFAKRQQSLDQKTLTYDKLKVKRKMKKPKAEAIGQKLGSNRKLSSKSLKMANSPCKLKICFDLSLAYFMSAPQFWKTFKQLRRCYSINRRASAPLQLYITGYTNKTKQSMSKMSKCFKWDINFTQQSYCEVFDKSDIIYLTSDSPNVLESLDYDKVYVIGALVDHSSLKNSVCYEKALKENVGHARLPLDTYFNIETRKVLALDKVYSILLRLTEGNIWADAIMLSISPKHKDTKVKDSTLVKDEVNNDKSEECLENWFGFQ